MIRTTRFTLLLALAGLTGWAGLVAAEAWKPIPNIAGFKVQVPPHAVPNGVGGAAGFHSKAGNFEFQLRPASAEEAKLNFATARKEAEDNEFVEFNRWVERKQTADGWVLIYEEENLIVKGEEWVSDGVRYAFDVRRTFGGKAYKCYGTLRKVADAKAAARACASIRKG